MAVSLGYSAFTSCSAAAQMTRSVAIDMALQAPASNIHSGISMGRALTSGVGPQRMTSSPCHWHYLA
jgi:hypothetical protein